VPDVSPVPAPPWSITLADGSANVWRFICAVGTTPAWAYEPVAPADSSSGVYSGGTASAGALDDDTARALWTAAQAALRDTTHHIAARRMGTSALTVERSGESVTVLVAGGPSLTTLIAQAKTLLPQEGP
jgi:hypothetical protein